MRTVNVEYAADRCGDSAVKVPVFELRLHCLTNSRSGAAGKPAGLDAGTVGDDVILAIAFVDVNKHAVDLILRKRLFCGVAYVGERAACNRRDGNSDDFFMRLRVEVADTRI